MLRVIANLANPRILPASSDVPGRCSFLPSAAATTLAFQTPVQVLIIIAEFVGKSLQKHAKFLC